MNDKLVVTTLLVPSCDFGNHVWHDRPGCRYCVRCGLRISWVVYEELVSKRFRRK